METSKIATTATTLNYNASTQIYRLKKHLTTKLQKNYRKLQNFIKTTKNYNNNYKTTNVVSYVIDY